MVPHHYDNANTIYYEESGVDLVELVEEVGSEELKLESIKAPVAHEANLAGV